MKAASRSTYQACGQCSAKWFGRSSNTHCPRCGAGTLPAASMTPPWESVSDAETIVRLVRRQPQSERTRIMVDALVRRLPMNKKTRPLGSVFQQLWIEVTDGPIPEEIGIVLSPKRRATTQRVIECFTAAPSRGTLLALVHHLAARCQSDEMQTIHRVNRYVLRVLRHGHQNVTIGREGWASIASLLRVVNSQLLKFGLWRQWLDQDLLRQANLDKLERLQIDGPCIRARYGHSLDRILAGTEAEPAGLLFHGTDAHLLPEIQATGLHPGRRYLVHLTSDHDYATQVAATHETPVVLSISSQRAINSVVMFWRANSHVWQSTPIPPDCIGGVGI